MGTRSEPPESTQDRGRDARYRAPPAQIPASGIPAPGSHLGCLATKRPPPEIGDVMAEVRKRRRVGRNSMIGVEAHHDPAQPRPLLIDCLMHSSTQRVLNRPQRGAHPVAARLPPELEASPPVLPADVDEAKKVKRLRFAETACPSVLRRVASELDKPRLPRVERQSKLRQTRPHALPK